MVTPRVTAGKCGRRTRKRARGGGRRREEEEEEDDGDDDDYGNEEEEEEGDDDYDDDDEEEEEEEEGESRWATGVSRQVDTGCPRGQPPRRTLEIRDVEQSVHS